MIFNRIVEVISDFLDLFRNQPPLDPMLAVPAVILMLTWPMFQVLFNDQPTAFMSAFVLAMAVRLALRFELLVIRMSKNASPKTIGMVALLAGPGILALLIWIGEPIWCQRFLTAYFVLMACLHELDALGGENKIVAANWPGLVLPRASLTMSRALVIYYAGMALVNEALIAHGGPTIWLLYFGVLPLMSRVLLNALFETVRRGFQGMA